MKLNTFTTMPMFAVLTAGAVLLSGNAFAQAAPAQPNAVAPKTVLPTEVVIKPKAKADASKVKPLTKPKRSKAKVDQAQVDQPMAKSSKGNAAKGSRAQQGLAAQFAKADVDKAGKITKKQAFNAKMYEVDRYFFDMDTDIDGYVTLDELTKWKANPVRTAPRPRGDKLDRFVDGDGKRR